MPPAPPRLPRAVLLGLLAVLVALAAALVREPGAEGQGGARKRERHGGNILFENIEPIAEVREHVLFSHQLHLDRGAECRDCHNGTVFRKERKIGANKFTMKDIFRGKACGACHDGVKRMEDGGRVFGPTRNCERCHNVKVRKPEE